MAVYVDDAFAHGDWGRWTGGGHLQADGLDELHAFAARLGLRPEWVQRRPGRAERDHYDLPAARRTFALRLGAQAETIREGVERRRAATAPGHGARPAGRSGEAVRAA